MPGSLSVLLRFWQRTFLHSHHIFVISVRTKHKNTTTKKCSYPDDTNYELFDRGTEKFTSHSPYCHNTLSALFFYLVFFFSFSGDKMMEWRANLVQLICVQCHWIMATFFMMIFFCCYLLFKDVRRCQMNIFRFKSFRLFHFFFRACKWVRMRTNHTHTVRRKTMKI